MRVASRTDGWPTRSCARWPAGRLLGGEMAGFGPSMTELFEPMIDGAALPPFGMFGAHTFCQAEMAPNDTDDEEGMPPKAAKKSAPKKPKRKQGPSEAQ